MTLTKTVQNRLFQQKRRARWHEGSGTRVYRVHYPDCASPIEMTKADFNHHYRELGHDARAERCIDGEWKPVALQEELL